MFGLFSFPTLSRHFERLGSDDCSAISVSLSTPASARKLLLSGETSVVMSAPSFGSSSGPLLVLPVVALASSGTALVVIERLATRTGFMSSGIPDSLNCLAVLFDSMHGQFGSTPSETAASVSTTPKGPFSFTLATGSLTARFSKA
ncbi:unnamed protein product [Ixodes pacificus]